MSLDSSLIVPNFSKSALKKLNKKVQKAIVTYSGLITFSNEPTNILLLINGGLKNDVSRECLQTSLDSLNIEFLDLVMPREQVFSLIVFQNINSTLPAYKLLHGHVLHTPELTARSTVTLCCAFVEKAPSLLDHIEPDDSSEMPEGLILHCDIISEDESVALVESVLENLSGCSPNSSLKHRFVRHFGYEFLYDSNRVDTSKPLTDSPMPNSCQKLIDRLMAKSLLQHHPDQLTVNVYEPGQGIPPHVDTHSVFEDEIVSVSLLSDIVMHFSNPLKKDNRSILLPRNSLLIMKGESRYLWRHSITPRKYDLIQKPCGRWTKIFRTKRVSLTFRKVKQTPECYCKWSSMCDFQTAKSEQEKPNVPRVCLDNPLELERKYVKDVYENIASHFSSTRHSGWPAVVSFLKSLNSGDVLVDIGCGNGKYLRSNPNLIVLPSDFSFNLCSICKEKGGDPVQSDMLRLPYRSSMADSAICIAAIHHLSTEERRSAAVAEIARVVKPGGRVLITVWALDQQHEGGDSNYISQHKEESICADGSSNLSTGGMTVHVNRTRFRDKDMLVPWHNRSTDKSSTDLYHRYYHLFSVGELEDLCSTSGHFHVQSSFYDQGNWCLTAVRS